MCADGERTRICVPGDYVKFELPEEDRATYVYIGVDIKDIPKVNDKDFSITMNAYFIVKWQDRRLIVEKRNRTSKHYFDDLVNRYLLSTLEVNPFPCRAIKLILKLSYLALPNCPSLQAI